MISNSNIIVIPVFRITEEKTALQLALVAREHRFQTRCWERGARFPCAGGVAQITKLLCSSLLFLKEKNVWIVLLKGGALVLFGTVFTTHKSQYCVSGLSASRI